MEYDLPSFDAVGGKPFIAAQNAGSIDTALAKALGPGAEPQLEPPRRNHTHLPFGRLENGQALHDARVRELNGADEEELARVSGSPLRWLDTVLTLGTVEVGDQPATKETLRALTLADRDTLLVAIRIATYGGLVKFDGWQCPYCARASDLTVDLADLEIRTPQDPTARTWVVETRGALVTLRYPTGADQMAFDGKDLSAAQSNSLLLSRLITAYDTDGESRAGSLGLAKTLGMADRRTLLESVREHTYGPRYDEVTMTHEACGEEVPIPLTPGDLFRD